MTVGGIHELYDRGYDLNDIADTLAADPKGFEDVGFRMARILVAVAISELELLRFAMSGE